MNARRFSLTTVALCLALSVVDQASAYYAAHMGRFTSRDPAGEVGRFGTGMPPDSRIGMAFVDRDQFDPMAQYHDGMNLYQYGMSNPTGRIDPTGLESFYVCERDIGPGGGKGDATARGCGCQHQDIYGDESGPIRTGFGGAAIGGGAGLPKGPGWKCTKLDRRNYFNPERWPLVDKQVRHGSGAGKDCKNATSADIKACLAAAPKPPGTAGLVNNCQTDVYNAASDCCLNGSPPWTIVPRPPIYEPYPM